MAQKNKIPKFTLWLEFELEHWQNTVYDPEHEFFNMKVTLETGKVYALNVWTYKFLESCIGVRRGDRSRWDELRSCGECPTKPIENEYLHPPDLLVTRLDRKLMEEIIASFLQDWGGRLLTEWECEPDLPDEMK